MFSEYQKGRTPNPDVLCNREIKFDLFLKAAAELGADYIATGHYCRKETIAVGENKIYRLLAGTDPSKEQSYFLCQLNQMQLSKALFPIGHLHKSEIRRIAREQELVTADRKDSQGICFVGKVDLPVFLQQKLLSLAGDIIEIDKNSKKFFPNRPNLSLNYEHNELAVFCEPFIYNFNDGTKIGSHNGAHFYTIGQRKGLNVGGKAEPLFVISTDIESNIIYVGQGHDHPGLNRYGLFIPENDIHWIREDLIMKDGESRNYLVRIRYRQPLQKATVYKRSDGLYILFEEAQRGITPGQFATWYEDDELIGSGVIA
jgi:tRNA-specific 2-thiouridylase